MCNINYIMHKESQEDTEELTFSASMKLDICMHQETLANNIDSFSVNGFVKAGSALR